MAIVIKREGGPARRVDEGGFIDEAELQRLVQNDPDAIPIDEIAQGAVLLTLIREYPTPSGPIDAIGIDQFGGLYLIETKLYRNPDKRTVIAQILDYGASLWKHSVDSVAFFEQIERDVQRREGVSTEEYVRRRYGKSEEEYSQLIESVGQNLVGGRYRFIVLMDTVDERLRDIVIYLNQGASFELYAVELEHYQDQDLHVIVPHLIGVVARPPNPPSSGTRRTWSEKELLEDAEATLSETSYKAFVDLYRWSVDRATGVRLGTGLRRGSFSPVFASISGKSLYTIRTDGQLTPNFGWLRETSHGDQVSKVFRQRLVEAGFPIPEDREYAAVSAEVWVPLVDVFKRIVQGLVS